MVTNGTGSPPVLGMGGRVVGTGVVGTGVVGTRVVCEGRGAQATVKLLCLARTPDATDWPVTRTVFEPQMAGTRTGSSMDS